MIFFPLPPPPSVTDNNIITTVQQEKVQFPTNGLTTSVELFKETPISLVGEIITTKRGDIYTTVSFKEEVNEGGYQNLDSEYFTENIDVVSPLKVNKTLKVKLKVRSAEKFSPKIFID